MIKRLTTADELLESERLIATAFLHPWDEREAREVCDALAQGTAPHAEERWGLFDEAGAMAASFSTLRHCFAFGSERIPVGEVHMVGSLPESRGGGNVRTLMSQVLHDFKRRGDVFAMLIPFSFAFYRKFGFELAARTLTQRVPIAQLAGARCDYDVTRVSCEDDVETVRALYEAFAARRNFANLRDDADWKYVGNGEYGERDFMHRDCQRYTYVLWDEGRAARGYLSFTFVAGANGPFIGELKVKDLVYDSPQAFWAALGFLYRMRAKATHVTFELMDDIDLAMLLPEAEDVQRSLGGHVMARLLDVPCALRLMPHPQGSGGYTVQVEDAFMPENSGTLHVEYSDGRAMSVEPTTDEPDLAVSEETLCQLVLGRTCLADARYRAGVQVVGNERVLDEVFVRRPVSLDL